MAEGLLSVNSTIGEQSGSWTKIAEVSNTTNDLAIITPSLDGYLLVTMVCKINYGISNTYNMDVGIMKLNVNFNQYSPFSINFISIGSKTLSAATYYAPIFYRVSDSDTSNVSYIVYRSDGNESFSEIKSGEKSFGISHYQSSSYKQTTGNVGAISATFYGIKATF